MTALAPGLRAPTRAGVLVALTAVGCATPDPAFQDAQGRSLRDLEPAPFSVAVAPLADDGVPLDSAAGAEDGLHFILSREDVQARLLSELKALNAASVVFAVGDNALEEARARRADLLIRPRVRQPAHFEHIGASEHSWSSGALWFVSWIGSFWIEDSTYSAQMQVDFDIINPSDNLRIDSITAASDTKDLSFWDRNDVASWATVESVVLLPFWTSDDSETTSRSLSEVACSRHAARLARYLKEDVHATEQEYLGELRLESPVNGAEAGSQVSVKGKLITREPVTGLFMYLNDSDEPLLELTATGLPPAAEQRRGNTYQVLFDQVVDLAPGMNAIAIEIGIAGRLSSRTIAVSNGPDVVP